MSVADIFEAVLGDDSPVAVEAYDGSRTGPITAATTLHVRSPQALQYLVTAPNDLGMARAYVTDQLDIDGDLYAALHAIASRDFAAVSLLEKVKLFRSVGVSNLRRPPVPDQEAHLSGRRHSKQRDAAAISHHYDVSNDFYRMVLGPSMAYTCALYPTESATLEEAQAAKFDLVKGFAVGRTIFGQVAREWLSDRIGDEQAVAAMADNYRRLCQIWDAARAKAGEEGA